MSASADTPKARAARAALAYVEDGMVLGLGSGSTAEIFIALLGERVKTGLSVQGVPTSEASADAARKAGVPLMDMAAVQHIDLTVDGADEVGPDLTLIKGGGGCLLREKIIADASTRMIVIVDDSKIVPVLGTFPLPVEVDRFGVQISAQKIARALKSAGIADASIGLRMDKSGQAPFITDGGHAILDCACTRIERPRAVAAALCAVPGVVEHGLFVDLARLVLVGNAAGVTLLEP